MTGPDDSGAQVPDRLDLPCWLLLVAVWSWAVAPDALLHGASLWGLGPTTLQNAAVLLAAIPCAWRYGMNTHAAPLVLVYGLVLVQTYTLATWLPGISALQPFKSLFALLLAPLLFQIRQPPTLRRMLLRSLPWLPVLCVAAGVVAWAALDWTPVRRDGTGALRLRGIVIAAYLGMLGVVGLMAALHPSREGTRRTLLGLALFAIVVWSGSRLTTACSLLLFASFLVPELWRGLRGGPRAPLRRALAVCAALLLILASYAEQGHRRFTTPLDGTARNARMRKEPLPRINDSGRMYHWNLYLDRARENLAFGCGLGAATQRVGKDFKAPHNEFLRALLEGGVTALAALGLAYTWVLVQARQRVAEAARSHVGICLVVFALLCCACNPISAQIFAIPFWAYLAAASQGGSREIGASRAAAPPAYVRSA